MKMSRLNTSSVILTVVGAAALLGFGAEAPQAPIEVRVAHPSRGTIHRFITLPGTLRADQQATLYAKVPGYLKSLAVERGDAVQAGQVLAEIEVPELEADRAESQTEVRVAEIESRRITAARSSAPDLVTPQAVDEAQGRFELAQARLEHAETLWRFRRILAPFDGIVTTRYVDPGAFVPAASAGASASTAAIVTLMDFKTIRVVVPVPEFEASRVRPGQPVRLNVEGIPGRTFEGSVSRHGFALDEASRSLPVEADLPNPELELRPGMYATVRIGVERHADALLVPSEALVIDKANAFVFLADSGRARRTAVKIGFNDGLKAEVLSGLDGTEAVILVGKPPPADGAAVSPKEAK
jgi:membrane fusion protein (multidrug efflux system)